MATVVDLGVTTGSYDGRGDTAPTLPLTINTDVNLLAAGNSSFRIFGGNNKERIQLDSYANGGTSDATYGGRGCQGTPTAFTATTSGQNLVSMSGAGVDNANAATGNKIKYSLQAAEAWTTTAQGTRYIWNTTAAGTVTLSEKMRLESPGYLGINDITPDRPLAINSSIVTLGTGNGAVVIKGTTNTEAFEAQTFGTAANSPGLYGINAQGTVAAPTATTIDSRLLFVSGGGYDNAGTPARAGSKGAFIVKAAEAFTTVAQGTYQTWENTPIGSTTRAEVMRLTAAGNLGVLTTAPLAKLSVGAGSFADSNLPIQISTGASGETWFAANRNGTYGLIVGYDITNGYAAVRQTHATESLRLIVNSTTMAMTLLSSGNVGVGTTSPAEKLHVEKTGDVTTTGLAQVLQPGMTTDGREVNVAIGKALSTAACGLFGYRYDTNAGDETAYMAIYGDSTGVFVRKGGNVGIGTTVPSQRLHVATATADDAAGIAQVQNTTNATGATSNSQLIMKSVNGTSQYMQWENKGLRMGVRSVAAGVGDLYMTTGTDSVRITVVDSTGHVGVGGTPTSRLDVAGGFIRYRRTSYTASNGAQLLTTPTTGFITVTGPTAAFSFYGITAGQDGDILFLHNTTGQNMTLTNLSGTPAASARIYTLTGADLVGVGTGAALLIYDGAQGVWIVMSWMA